MAPPRFQPTPEQQALLDQLAAVAAELAEVERRHREVEERLRARRDSALLATVNAGVSVTAAAAAAHLSRANSHIALNKLGYIGRADNLP